MNITITHGNFLASINPKGAELNSLKNTTTSKEYIWEGNSKFWGKHSPVLFPIVGALKNDSYFLEGRKHEMSRHGFARDYEFELIESRSNLAVFQLVENEETLLKFPFRFTLKLKYELIDKKLIISYYVNNNSNARLPFCIGAHPAFSLPNSFSDYSLQFEKEELLQAHELEENLFSGTTRNIEIDKRKLPLNYILFEKDALVFKTILSKKITIFENEKPILTVDFSDFSSLGIWTVPNAPFICIEPWIGFADNFDSNGNLFEKENVQVLEPYESFEVAFSVSIH